MTNPRPRVLVADDHLGFLVAVQRLLEPSCDVVRTVQDGEALLEATADLKPDIVVVDIHMPYVNGLSACRQIKGATPEIKIIVLTGYSEPGTRERALNAGASAFVLKHSMADDLIPAIQNALLDRS